MRTCTIFTTIKGAALRPSQWNLRPRRRDEPSSIATAGPRETGVGEPASPALTGRQIVTGEALGQVGHQRPVRLTLFTRVRARTSPYAVCVWSAAAARERPRSGLLRLLPGALTTSFRRQAAGPNELEHRRAHGDPACRPDHPVLFDRAFREVRSLHRAPVLGPRRAREMGYDLRDESPTGWRAPETFRRACAPAYRSSRDPRPVTSAGPRPTTIPGLKRPRFRRRLDQVPRRHTSARSRACRSRPGRKRSFSHRALLDFIGDARFGSRSRHRAACRDGELKPLLKSSKRLQERESHSDIRSLRESAAAAASPGRDNRLPHSAGGRFVARFTVSADRQTGSYAAKHLRTFQGRRTTQTDHRSEHAHTSPEPKRRHASPAMSRAQPADKLPTLVTGRCRRWRQTVPRTVPRTPQFLQN